MCVILYISYPLSDYCLFRIFLFIYRLSINYRSEPSDETHRTHNYTKPSINIPVSENSTSGWLKYSIDNRPFSGWSQKTSSTSVKFKSRLTANSYNSTACRNQSALKRDMREFTKNVYTHTRSVNNSSRSRHKHSNSRYTSRPQEKHNDYGYYGPSKPKRSNTSPNGIPYEDTRTSKQFDKSHKENSRLLVDEVNAQLDVTQSLLDEIHHPESHPSNHQQIATDASVGIGLSTSTGSTRVYSSRTISELRSYLKQLFDGVTNEKRNRNIRDIKEYIERTTVNRRIPRDIEISLFICNNLKLNHMSFGLDEIAGNKRLQCIQERIKNTIMCDIHGIPLKRTNVPGKNSEWYNNLNSLHQHEVSTHLDDLNPIGWNDRKKSANKIYAPINDLRAQVIEEQKLYKHNLHQN